MKIENIDYEIPVKEITLGDKKVRVKQYLPVREKINLFDAIRDWCFNGHLIDQPKIDALFNAFLILSYTDIEFAFEKEEEVLEFYDYMEVNSYIFPIINIIPEVEYNALISYYNNTVNDFNKFKSSSLATLANLLEHGKELMEEIGEISKEIDVEAIKLVAEISNKLG